VSTIGALRKGLRILALFNERHPVLRVTDIAAATGMPLTTVYRAVLTLAADDYLERLPDGSYRPGWRVLGLGAAALRAADLVLAGAPPLAALARATGQRVNLAVLDGDNVLYLVCLGSPHVVTSSVQVGSTRPAGRTAIGKLLLAYLGGTPPPELCAELAQIRTQGWAVQDDELARGLCSVAAPVRDPAGRVVAGANVMQPAGASQFPMSELTPRLVRCCAEISAAIPG
jgi:IclR family transcriptional regulator, pca regulon regulatory protein